MKISILIIGGDGRIRLRGLDCVQIEVIRSQKAGGNRGQASAVKKIRNGKIQIVFLMTKWLGHSMFQSVRVACKKAGVETQIIRGGKSQLKRQIGTRFEGEE